MLHLTVEGNQQEGLDITWSITDKCNFNCPYCLVPKGNYFTDYSLIDELNNYKDNIRTLILFGGEPTLHPNILEIVKKLKISDLRIWTNFSADIDLYLELIKYARLNITFHHHNLNDFIQKLKKVGNNIKVYMPVSHNFKKTEYEVLSNITPVTTIPIVGIDNYYDEQPQVNEEIKIKVSGDINAIFDNTNFNDIHFQPYLVSCSRNQITLDIIHDKFSICGHVFNSLSEAISKPIMCSNKCNVCFYHIGTKKGLFKGDI